MEQATTPLDHPDIDDPGIVTEQKRYFWNVKPVEIATWTQQHKPELALLMGMTLTSCLISGAAMAVLFSPNLGQTLTYEPLIDDATLAASRRISLGEQLLGQVARVLEIEIIETQGPEVGRHTVTAPAMTIVAQADNAAPMPEADVALGLKAMVLAAGVGLGVTGLIRLVPLIPFSALGPRRRQPLSRRLRASDVSTSQPFAPVLSNRPVGPNQALIPDALTSLTVPKGGLAAGLTNDALPPSHTNQGRRTRANSQPRQYRSRRQAVRRRLAKTAISGRNLVSGSRSGKTPPHNIAKPGNTVGREGISQETQRSQAIPPPRSQPVSFVPLSSFTEGSLIPGENRALRNTALWPNNQAAKQVPAAPARFDFLDELDMRRQYPLENDR